jgi:uracil-DNA glycosylase
MSNEIFNEAFSCVPLGWSEVFYNASSVLQCISSTLDEKKCEYVPNVSSMFGAFHLTKLSEVRVVMIGNYPNPNIDKDEVSILHGLAFATSPEILQNITKELKSCYPDSKNPDLISWALQGVLLINMSLTSRTDKNNEHFEKGLWFPFLKIVFNAISLENPNCIYVAWGREANKVLNFAGKKSRILTASHPNMKENGFFGCDHFKMINDMLLNDGYDAITW